MAPIRGVFIGVVHCADESDAPPSSEQMAKCPYIVLMY